MLQALLASDPFRRDALEVVATLGLPDGWIGAGFVRDAVWDDRHGFPRRRPVGDIDVLWFDDVTADRGVDAALQKELSIRRPGIEWSVKNQARMHRRNGDVPYGCVADAMRRWPETATAVAARIGTDGQVEINAPLGVDDLFALRLRPTEAFIADKRQVFDDRIASKRWLDRYPLLVVT